MNDGPYRKPVPVSTDGYRAAWVDYRRRRARLWIIFFSWPVVAVLISSVVHGAGVHGDGAMGFIFLAFAVVVVVVWISFALFKCPRCGEPFHQRRRTPGGLNDPAVVAEILRGLTPMEWLKRRRLPTLGACASCGLVVGTPNYATADDAGAATPSLRSRPRQSAAYALVVVPFSISKVILIAIITVAVFGPRYLIGPARLAKLGRWGRSLSRGDRILILAVVTVATWVLTIGALGLGGGR